MESNVLVYSLALGLSSLVALGLAVMSYFRLSVAGASSFLFGNLAILAYCLGSLLEIHASTASQVLACLTLEYVGITTIAPLWYLTAQSAAGESWKVSTGQRALMFIVPILLVILVSTNDFHHLFYSDLTVTRRGGFTIPVLEKGPYYLLNMVHMNVFLVLAALTSLRAIPRVHGNHRFSMVLLFLSSLFPWAGMIVYQLGLSPWGLDTAPFGLVFSGILNAVALFRYHLFAVSPLVIEQVFENMKEAVLVLDQRRRLIGFNAAMAKVIPGLSADSAGQPVESLVARLPLLGRLRRRADGTIEDLEVQEGGGQRVYQIDSSPLLDRKKSPLGEIYMLTDVTQRHELQLKLALLARTDELTGLPNRRDFLERLRQTEDHRARFGGRYTLAMVDIDHFKHVNDRWGHDAGDAALVHLSRLWSSHLRSTDVLARFGGEEFVLLLAETGADEAWVVLERFRTATEGQALAWRKGSLALTASFGFATAETTFEGTIDALLKRADDALYSAKESGRNCVKGDLVGVR